MRRVKNPTPQNTRMARSAFIFWVWKQLMMRSRQTLKRREREKKRTQDWWLWCRILVQFSTYWGVVLTNSKQLPPNRGIVPNGKAWRFLNWVPELHLQPKNCSPAYDERKTCRLRSWRFHRRRCYCSPGGSSTSSSAEISPRMLLWYPYLDLPFFFLIFDLTNPFKRKMLLLVLPPKTSPSYYFYHYFLLLLFF